MEYSPAVNVKLPPLHNGGQYQAFYDDARFKVLVCGRRWGKSLLAGIALVTCAINGGIGWWVWPSYPMSTVGWRKLIELLEPLIKHKIVTIDRQERAIHFPGGGLIQMKSAERANSLRGEGLDLVVIDEWAYIKNGKIVWESDLRPALAEKMGKAFLISTPNGVDHLFEYYHRAKTSSEYKAYRFPTWTNPYIPEAEIEAARNEMEEDIYRQEYGAEFLQDAATYFKDISKIMIAKPQEKPIEGHLYRAGLDWAAVGDETILTIGDMDLYPREAVKIYRIPQITMTYQHGEIVDKLKYWDVDILRADGTGLGYGPTERIAEENICDVQLVKYTNANKREMFTQLKTAYDAQEFLIPDEEWLKTQHMMMVPEVNPLSLTVTINARPGFCDDGPNSLALLNQAMKEPRIEMFGG